MSTLTGTLVRLLRRPIGAADRARAALHVLDWAGCAAAGALTPPGRVMLAYGATLGPGTARTLGGLALPAADAALVGGAFGNVLEMDDFYRTALVHPGPVVVPAALALAQETGASGPALLDAVIRGFEAMIRIGRSVGPTHYRHFHNTATCGAFGSAAACAALLGLDERREIDALGHAGTLAAGLWQCRLEDTMSKQLHNGHAAQTGLIAARLARHGLTGAAQILEGELGFFSGLCPDGVPERVVAEPAAPWLIHGCSLKPWPACRHTHALIDAALVLRGDLDPGRIAGVTAVSYRDAVLVCDNPSPRTPVEAKFSLQHAAASVLIRGRPLLEHFDMAGVGEAAVAALRARVAVAEEARFTERYPARFGAALTVTLDDGRVLTHEVADAFGDPENPMSRTDILDKAVMLLDASGYTEIEAVSVVAGALALTEDGTVGALMRALH